MVVFGYENIVIELCILLFLDAVYISDVSLSGSGVFRICFLIWSSINSLIFTKTATLQQVSSRTFHKESHFIALPRWCRPKRWEFGIFEGIGWFLLKFCPSKPPNLCIVHRSSAMPIILSIFFSFFSNHLLFFLCPIGPASFIDCSSTHTHLQKWKDEQIVSTVKFQFFQ